MSSLLHPEEERRSYAGAFALCAGALLAVALWCVEDDVFSRRPWKKYQAELHRAEIHAVERQIDADEARLEHDQEYRALVSKAMEARRRLAMGERARARERLELRLARAQLRLEEAEQDQRFVNSELEEARYEFERDLQMRRSVDRAEARLRRLEARKGRVELRVGEARRDYERVKLAIDSLRGEIVALEGEVAKRRKDVEGLYRKLDQITVLAARFYVPRLGYQWLSLAPVPRIKQIVLQDFERSNFDAPLARVDRCESCHATINEPGYEHAENPLKTHPDRGAILDRHPPEKFGCTPCHAGQGAALNSAAEAHGEVEFWSHPLRRGRDVQIGCIGCHDNVQGLAGADSIARGERLFEQLGCHGCHLTAGYEDLPRAGPSLRRLAAKVNHGWLVDWIRNPHSFRPRTRMPTFEFGEDEAVSIAAFLLQASRDESRSWLRNHEEPTGVNTGDTRQVAAGRTLAESLGCRGCHAFQSDQVAGSLGENKDVAPNLSNLAAKVGSRWLYYWLRNPRDYSPVARMPNLRLSRGEVSAVVSYLMTLGAAARPGSDLEARLVAKEQAESGERLIRKYGCFGCHDIPGMENEWRNGVELSAFGDKPVGLLFFGDRTDIPRTWHDWTYNKLRQPRAYATRWIEQLMPNFELDDGDIRALMRFLASRTDATVPEGYRYARGPTDAQTLAGRRLVQRYNCMGCHVIDGRGGDIRRDYVGREALAPPSLAGEGSKVRAPWLFRFLKNPVPVRPWLSVRMPSFEFSDAEANQLVAYFGALDNIDKPFVYMDRTAIAPENVKAGRVLASEGYFDCFSCHQEGEKKPEGPKDGWAPDLALARERLRPDWMSRWIADPQALMPGTKMPSYYPEGPPDVLGGDDERQIRALRDYMLMLGDGR